MKKTTTVIESSDNSINSTAEMLKIKAGFKEMDFDKIPRELIDQENPFRAYTKKWSEWKVSCSNVWALRNSDPKIIKAFKRALINEKARIDDINVEHD